MLIVLAVFNALAFILMGLDKAFARHHAWRIPEAVLLLSAACFGALGAWLGMGLFRHKTRTPKFTVTVPLLLAAQIAACYFIFRT